jgi:hypothetical protein
MPVRENRQGASVRGLHAPSRVPNHTQTAAKSAELSPSAPGFTAETVSPLERAGFEPSLRDGKDIDFRGSSLDITFPLPRERPNFVPVIRLICRRRAGRRPAESRALKELLNERACDMGRVLTRLSEGQRAAADRLIGSRRRRAPQWPAHVTSHGRATWPCRRCGCSEFGRPDRPVRDHHEVSQSRGKRDHRTN